jgi:hypothetical protein
MLTDAELAAIETEARAATAKPWAYWEDAPSYCGRAPRDVLTLVAEVRRLRTLAATQTGAATSKARGLQSRGRAASSRRPEAPTRARRLAGRPTPAAAAPLADSR